MKNYNIKIICPLCKEEFNNKDSSRTFICHLRKIHNINKDTQEFYDFLRDIYYPSINKITNCGRCLNCGSTNVEFIKFYSGFKDFCCPECKKIVIEKKKRETSRLHYGVDHPLKSKIITDKIRKTCKNRTDSQRKAITSKIRATNIEKYGVDHPAKSKIIKDKIRNTNLERYGVTSYFNTSEYKEKTIDTSLKKYGVDNPNKSEIIKNKIRKTCLDKYGKEYFSQTEEFRNKLTKNSLEKYGTNYPCQSDIIRKRIRETNLEKYGKEYYFQTEEFKDRQREFSQKRYGTDYPSQAKEVKNKIVATSQERYGVNCYTQTNEYKEKVKATSQKKYGLNHHLSVKDIIDKRIKTRRSDYFNKFKDILETRGIFLNFDIEYFLDIKNQIYSYYCLSCNRNFNSKYIDILKIKCPRCDSNRSKTEREIIEYIESIYSGNIEYNIRTLGIRDTGKKEIDIFIPELKLAIEVDGIYWHCDYLTTSRGTNIDAQLLKTIDCHKHGITLLHITDYDWNKRRTATQSLLKQWICSSILSDLIVKELTLQEFEDFKDKFSLDISNPYLDSVLIGVFNSNKLIGSVEFNSNKLLRYFSNNVHYKYYIKPIIDYYLPKVKDKILFVDCDLRVDNGEVFSTLGWKIVDYITPKHIYFSRDEFYPHCEEDLKINNTDTSNYWSMMDSKYVGYYNCGYLRYVFDYQNLQSEGKELLSTSQQSIIDNSDFYLSWG